MREMTPAKGPASPEKHGDDQKEPELPSSDILNQTFHTLFLLWTFLRKKKKQTKSCPSGRGGTCPSTLFLSLSPYAIFKETGISF
jgi:hypothetical protein